MNNPSATKNLLKIGPASKILGVSIDTLRRWEKAGKIEAIRTPGGTRLFKVEQPQTISPISTGELLKKAEEENVSGISKEKYDIQNTKYKIPNTKWASKFLIGSAGFLSVALVLTSLVVASHLFKGIKPSQFVAQQSKTDAAVLATTSASRFLEINSDTQINGNLFVRDQINGVSLEGTPSASTINLTSGNTSLTITKSTTLDQDVSTTATPTFNTLNLSATKDQLVFQSGGPTGTLTWTPTAIRTITLPDVTTTLVGIDNTQTLTNKSISGSDNTLTNIPISALTNAKITITAGSNLTGGGEIALGESKSIALKDSPVIAGTLTVTGATILSSTLAVTGTTTLSSTLAVNGVTYTYPSSQGSASTILQNNGSGTLTWASVSASGITADSLDFTEFIDNMTLDASTNIASAGFNLTFTGSGNVGIGATTSSNKLDVWGNTRITGNLTVDSTATLGNGLIGYSGVTAPASGLAISGNVGIGTTSPLAPLQVQGNGTNSAFFLNGNVGIGTTAPTAQLEVIAAAGNIITTFSGGNAAGVYPRAASLSLSVNFSGGMAETDIWNGLDPTLFPLTGIRFIQRLTASSFRDLMFLSNTGNVGIGTTSPLSLLSVAGNAHIGGLAQGISAPANGLFVDGNVGIGATTSSNKLDVWGNARITGNLTVDGSLSQGGSISAGSVFLASNGTAAAPSYSFTSSPSTGLWSPSANALALTTNGSATSGININSSGNVGIGTTSPNSLLEARQDQAGAGAAIWTRISLSNDTIDRQVFLGTYNGAPVVGAHNMALNAWEPLFVNAVDGSSGGNVIMAGNVGIGTSIPSQRFQVNASGTSAFVVTSGGNVGIGFTTPDRLLLAASNINITSSTTSLLGANGTQFGISGTGSSSGKKLVLGLDTTDNYGVIQAGNTDGTNYDISLNPAGGNIGIGTTSPGYKVEIGGSFTSPVNKNKGLLGITGTITPSSAFDAYGVATAFTAGSGSTNINSAIDYYAGSLTKGTSGTITNRAGVLIEDLTAAATNAWGLYIKAQTGGTSQNFTIYTAGGAHYFGGNVGIGTSAAQTSNALSVFGGVGIGNSGAGGFSNSTAPPFGLAVQGNVGIGTTSPVGINLGSTYRTLEVNNLDTGNSIANIYLRGASQSILSFQENNATANNKIWDIIAAGEELQFRTINDAYSVGIPYLQIDRTGTTIDSVSFPNGNVGIGTTVLQARLGVSGNVGIGVSFSRAVAPVNGLTVEGNVGIGTTTANSTLTIASGTLSSGAFSIGATAILPSGNQVGTQFDITSVSGAGANGNQTATRSVLEAGYTGSGQTRGLIAENYAASTGTTPISTGNANYGLYGYASGTTAGYNIGALGQANNSSVQNIGVLGVANQSLGSPQRNIGVVGLGLLGSSVNIGGYFGLTNADPTFTSAALIADNGSTTSPIFLARDTGSSVFIIADGGNVGIGSTATGSKLSVFGSVGIGNTGSNGFASSLAPPFGLAVQGNVGIGTTTANYNLSVVGTTNITGALSVGSLSNSGTFLAANGSASAPSFSFTNSTGIGLWSPASNILALTSGTPTANSTISGLSVNSSGNVGIGTSDPTSLLHLSSTFNTPNSGSLVNIDGTLTTGTNISALKINSTIVPANGSGAYGIRINGWTVGTSGSTLSDIVGMEIANPNMSANSATNQYMLYLDTPTRATNNFAIYSTGGISYLAGNVGIGFTSPSRILQVASEVNPAGTNASLIGTAGTTQLALTGSTAANLQKKLVLGIDTTDNYGVIQAGNTSGTNYDISLNPAGGNINIGTTAPNSKMTQGLTINQGTADNEILSFKSSDINQNETGILEADTFAGFTKHDANAGGLDIRTVTESGNTIPGFYFYTFTDGDTTKTSTSIGAHMLWAAGHGSGGGGGFIDGGNLLVIGNNSKNHFIFDENANEYLLPDTGISTLISGSTTSYFMGGNVGIGATAMNVKFAVQGNVGIGTSTGDTNATLTVVNPTIGGLPSSAATIIAVGSSDGTTGGSSIRAKGSVTGLLADFGEYFPFVGEKSDYAPGDLVANITGESVSKTESSYSSNIRGVVTKASSFIAGADENTTYDEQGYPTNRLAVALLGRVPIKVSTENGSINIGDYLTSSSIPGVAMKAIRAGPVVGKALESYDNSDPTIIGRVLVFVNVSYADPGNFLAGLSLDSDGNLIMPKIKTDKLLINDEGLTINDPTNTLLSYEMTPLANTSDGGTQSLLGGGSANTAVNVLASLKNLDNAIATNSAEIVSNREQIASTSAQTNSLAQQLASAAAELAATKSKVDSLNLTPPDILLATDSARLTINDERLTISEATVSGMLTAYQAEIQDNFKVFGNTTLGKTNIAGDLFVDGTLSIENGSELNVIGTLYLQKSALADKIDLFNGKVTIDKNGNIKAAGEIAGASIVTNKLTISNTPIASSSATLAASIGSSTIPQGQTKITISSADIGDTSKVFITPTTATDKVLSVTNIKKGESFDVEVLTPAGADINFNWWIVQTE